MNGQLYWIWLSLAMGPANIKSHRLLQRFPNPRDLYEAVMREQDTIPPLTPSEFERVRSVSLEKAEAVMKDCISKHIDVVNMTEPRYPQRLLHIYNPPVLLYTLGRYLPFNEKLVISMVGSRDITQTGYQIGRQIAHDLAARDVIVVSGLQVGGDSSAHIGALEAGGYTAAVIGCGCDINYPAKNRDLHVQVAMNGCILSEFAPGVEPSPSNFRMRNRILAGLANGVVVTECRPRSGALSTVGFALDEGRDVFAVPNNAMDTAHGGTFSLLQDGAVPVREAGDILSYYDLVSSVPAAGRNMTYPEPESHPSFRPNRPAVKESRPKSTASSPVQQEESAVHPASPVKPSPEKPEVPSAEPVPTVPPEEKPAESAPEKEMSSPAREETGDLFPEMEPSPTEEDVLLLSEEARKVYVLLNSEPLYIEKIIDTVGLPAARTLSALTELECLGFCKSLPGQRYVLPDAE